VLINGLAILGMREEERWLNAKDYKLKYSAVIVTALHKGVSQRNAVQKVLYIL
jgi:hypothetical protein